MSESEQHLYATLAKASYDFYHHGGIKAQKELNEYRTGYQLDADLSNKNATVMSKGNDVAISYRGTDLSNFSDLLADGEILFGRDKLGIFLNDRFDQADQLYNKVKEKYPNKEITLTGHSLGSGLGIYVGNKNNIKSVTFNEGVSPLGALFSRFGNRESSRKQTVYISAQDILSNLSILEPYNIKYVAGTDSSVTSFFTSHSLNYFLPNKPNKEPLPVFFQPVPKNVIRTIKMKTRDSYGQDYFKEIEASASGKKCVQKPGTDGCAIAFTDLVKRRALVY
jgi:hypothetical protein